MARDMLSALENCDTLMKNSPEARKLSGAGELGPSESLVRRAGIRSMQESLGTNPISQPILESLVRTAYSRYRGFEHVQAESDWKKPKNTQPNSTWTSKVDFDIMLRLDPALQPETLSTTFEDVEDEVRNERNRDVNLATVGDKLAAKAKVIDLINQ